MDKQKRTIYSLEERERQWRGNLCQHKQSSAMLWLRIPSKRPRERQNPPDLFLVWFVLPGRMNISRLKYGFCRFFYIHYFIHVIFLLFFFYLVNLEVSFSPAAMVQSDNTNTHHFLTVQYFVSPLEQNRTFRLIVFSATWLHMKRYGMRSVSVDPVSPVCIVLGSLDNYRTHSERLISLHVCLCSANI